MLISSYKDDCSQYALPIACFKFSVAASHIVVLSADSEVQLIKGSGAKKFFCCTAIVFFYEKFDFFGPEFASVNDLEHTLVLLLLWVLRV